MSAWRRKLDETLPVGIALAAVVAHLDALTEAQVLDMLSGLGDGVALEQAMQAAGLSLEETP